MRNSTPDEQAKAIAFGHELDREEAMTPNNPPVEQRHRDAAEAYACKFERGDLWAQGLAQAFASFEAGLDRPEATHSKSLVDALPSLRDAFMAGRQSCHGTDRHNADAAWRTYERATLSSEAEGVGG